MEIHVKPSSALLTSFAGLLVCALALLPAACGSGGEPGPGTVLPPAVPVSAKLVPIQGCEDLDAWLVDAGVDRYVHLWEMGGAVYGVPTPMPGGPFETPAEDGAAAGGERQTPTDHTTTNTQEAGVDEVDVVKTNGETIFYLQDSIVHVLDAWPAAEAREVARVELTGWDGGLFLLGDRLVAFTSIYEGGPQWMEPGLPTPMPGGMGDAMPGAPEGDGVAPPLPPEGEWEEPFNAVRVTILDVSDPTAPTVASVFDVEGSLVGARVVDDLVYLAAMHTPYLQDPELLEALEALDLPDPWNLSERQREQAVGDVRARVRPVIRDYVARAGRACFLPDVRGQDGTRTELLECTDLHRPERGADLTVLSVVAFDPADEAPAPDGVGILTNGWQLYASPEAIYVSQDSRWWFWSDTESRYAETHIHRIDLNAGSPAYRASGKVPGWILNQFSMSEHAGALRVATTDQTWNDWWWEPMPGTGGVVPPPMDDRPMPLATAAEAPPRDANNVFVLEPEGTDLVLIGALRGIAPDEQIYAVRFLGEIGYVVTFEQVDPLFTVDLSDPTAPQILGELHITGFSTYLHPVAPDHLIGVGRDGTPEGRVLGLQLQLFDVQDPAQPTRTHQEVLSTGDGTWSWSEAEHDHHAFTYEPVRSLLALPVTLEDWGWASAEYEHFSGIVVYHVSLEDGFAEMGRVSHTGLVREVECSPADRLDPTVDTACDGYLYPWYAHMRRSLFIEDVLYAFSNVGVTVSTLDALDEPIVTIPLD
jgi:hypothetical protein